VIEHDLRVINDARVHHEMLQCNEPTKISPVDSLGYKLIEHTTLQIFPDVAAIPGVMIALTDSRFYANLTHNIYRFLPIRLYQRDVARYHGIDERISLRNYDDLVNFYYVLMSNSDQAHLHLDFYKNNEL
jgi:carboxypeptidase PM20D1